MTSRTPRSASTASRPSKPAKWTTSLPPARLDHSTVSGPASDGSVPSTAPAANRSAGESVHGSTKTSPRTPRAGPMRPTTTNSPGSSATAGSATVDVDHVDANALAPDAGDHLAQRLRGAAVATDDAAEVLRVAPDLQPLPAPVVDHVHPDVVRVVHDPANEVLEGLLEHLALRRGLGGLRSRRLSGRLGRLLRCGLLRGRALLRRRGGRIVARAPVGLGEGSVEEGLLVRLLGRQLHRRGSREALELLPVAGDLEDRRDGLGRLGTDAEPVGGALAVDLDHRGVVLRVVLADRLDRPAVPLGAGVGDDDPVVRLTHLA